MCTNIYLCYKTDLLERSRTSVTYFCMLVMALCTHMRGVLHNLKNKPPTWREVEGMETKAASGQLTECYRYPIQHHKK